MDCKAVDWIQLIEVGVHSRAVVGRVIYFRVP